MSDKSTRAPRGSLTPEEARQRKNERQREYAKRTGYAANITYNQKTFIHINFDVRKELGEAFKQKCKDNGIPYSRILIKAIEDYMNES